MSDFAVVQIGGKQYKVKEDDTIEIEKQDSKIDSALVFDDILLLCSDGKVKIGKPTINSHSVIAKILEEKKGEKVRIAKFKAKSRYRRVKGHRQNYNLIKIEEIKEKKS